MPIGKPTYYTQRARTNWWALSPKVTSLTIKILPPLGTQAETGKWFQYCATHWATDSGNGKHSFQCAEERNNRVVTRTCPMCVRNAEIRAELENKSKAGVGEEYLAPLKQELFRTDTTRGYYLNVMNLKGEYGLLRISRDLKDVLDKAFESVRNDAKKPLDPIMNGVFFIVSRTGRGGMGGKVNYTVAPYIEVLGTTIVDGVTYERHDVKREPLTESQIKFIESNEFTGRDLANIAPKLKYEEVALLATGDETTVDRVFSTAKRSGFTAAPTAAPQVQPTTAATPPMTTPETTGATAVTTTPTPVAAAPTTVTPPAAPVATPTATPVAGKPVSELQKLTEAQLLDMFKTDGLK